MARIKSRECLHVESQQHKAEEGQQCHQEMMEWPLTPVQTQVVQTCHRVGVTDRDSMCTVDICMEIGRAHV